MLSRVYSIWADFGAGNYHANRISDANLAQLLRTNEEAFQWVSFFYNKCASKWPIFLQRSMVLFFRSFFGHFNSLFFFINTNSNGRIFCNKCAFKSVIFLTITKLTCQFFCHEEAFPRANFLQRMCISMAEFFVINVKPRNKCT